MQNKKILKFYNRIVFILALAGFIIAAYVLQSFLRGTSIVCVNSGCELVRKNAASYPFGIPVPAFGFVGYALLTLFALMRTMNEKRGLIIAMLAISLFGTTFVAWFTYTELFIIKAVCTWCAVSAVNMLFIFLLTLRSYTLVKHLGT